MSSSERLDLSIDIFKNKNEPAKALSNLTPPELVEAIIQEFRELEYVSDNPKDYVLLIKDKKNGYPRLKDTQLKQQSLNKKRLILAEIKKQPPEGTTHPAQHIYLREQSSGKVYKLHWQPAIIGRPDRNRDHNERIAVNLETYETGLRVSRRHAQITEKDGKHYIESMSRNPTSIKDAAGNIRPVIEEKQELHNGEVIYLERSNIALKFIIRS